MFLAYVCESKLSAFDVGFGTILLKYSRFIEFQEFLGEILENSGNVRNWAIITELRFYFSIHLELWVTSHPYIEMSLKIHGLNLRCLHSTGFFNVQSEMTIQSIGDENKTLIFISFFAQILKILLLLHLHQTNDLEGFFVTYGTNQALLVLSSKVEKSEINL